MRHLVLGLFILLVSGCVGLSTKPQSPAHTNASFLKPNADKLGGEIIIPSAPTSKLNYKGKAEFKRQRRKLENDHRVALKKYNESKAKIQKTHASQTAALARKKASLSKPKNEEAPLEQRISVLNKQKKEKTKVFNILEARLAKKKEALKLEEKKVQKERVVYQSFMKNVDVALSQAKSELEKIKANKISQGVSIAKEEAKVSQEMAASIAALEKEFQAAKDTYVKQILELNKKEKAAIEAAEESEKKAILAAKKARKAAKEQALALAKAAEKAKMEAQRKAKAIAELRARKKAEAEARERAKAAKEAAAKAAEEAKAAAAARAAAEAKAAALAMVKVKAQAASASLIENDTDRPGGDYRILVQEEASPKVCQSSCNAEAQCKAWTYVKPNILGDKARCFLKDSVTPKESSVCCISGVKK